MTSQAASGGDEGQSGGWQAASATRQEPPTAGVQKAAAQPAAAAAELSKKHKGGSGMHKKRDYGERKRATRRRNWQLAKNVFRQRRQLCRRISETFQSRCSRSVLPTGSVSALKFICAHFSSRKFKFKRKLNNFSVFNQSHERCCCFGDEILTLLALPVILWLIAVFNLNRNSIPLCVTSPMSRMKFFYAFSVQLIYNFSSTRFIEPLTVEMLESKLMFKSHWRIFSFLLSDEQYMASSQFYAWSWLR